MQIIKDVSLLHRPSEKTSVRKGLEIGRTLFATLEQVNKHSLNKQGIGLAAPQIGIFKTVCVLLLKGRRLVLVNPQIVERSSLQVDFEEQCLSLPGVVARTKRFLWVVVKADNLREPELFGTKLGVTTEEKILESVVVQHELDHLMGILIIDRNNNDESTYRVR